MTHREGGAVLARKADAGDGPGQGLQRVTHVVLLPSVPQQPHVLHGQPAEALDLDLAMHADGVVAAVDVQAAQLLGALGGQRWGRGRGSREWSGSVKEQQLAACMT